MMLAAAPSQEATLQALAAEEGIDWSRVTCFHMDDYIGLPQDAPQGFGNWLRRHFFSRVAGATFHSIDTTRAADEEAARYAGLMGEEPFDVVLLGLGVNGHLAFNDPPANLEDPESAKVITLDRVSRQQQVDEGLFDRFDDVPEQAITVTIPRLLNAVEIVGSVAGKAKRNAVADTLNQPVSGEYPGTALRTHPNAALYLDAEADPR
jgi:glucosamine-6-phosphate deaminase